MAKYPNRKIMVRFNILTSSVVISYVTVHPEQKRLVLFWVIQPYLRILLSVVFIYPVPQYLPILWLATFYRNDPPEPRSIVICFIQENFYPLIIEHSFINVRFPP